VAAPGYPSWEELCPLLGWLPAKKMKETFAAVTQLGRAPTSKNLEKQFKLPLPAPSAHHWSEPVGTDAVDSDPPSVNSGVTSAQIFVGAKTLVTSVHPMETDKQLVDARRHNTRTRGAASKLLDDHAQVEISDEVEDVHR
jgi:hypothetical protein